jgi:hypothetical protein
LINFANRFGIIIFKTYETKDFEAIEEQIRVVQYRTVHIAAYRTVGSGTFFIENIYQSR